MPRTSRAPLSVLKDASIGAIEGIAAAAGASLAARIVRGTTARGVRRAVERGSTVNAGPDLLRPGVGARTWSEVVSW